MRKFFLASFLSIVSMNVARADIIAQWNFNSLVADTNTATGVVSPNIGLGTAALVGGTTATFASGDASGGSTDPATGDDSGWNTSTYPALGVGNKTAGVQFAASTLGYKDIFFVFDQRQSNSSNNTWRVQYSLDGTNFIDSTQFTVTPSSTAGDVWYNSRTIDLTTLTGLNNNPNAAFRVVSEFDPGSGNYLATETTYATTGTARFDMVTVSGTVAIPEPTSLAFVCVAGLGLFIRRKKSTIFYHRPRPFPLHSWCSLK